LRFERDWLLRGPCARGTKIKARIQRDMQLINREKFQSEKGFSFEVQGQRLGGKVLELKGISKNYPKGYENQNEKNTETTPVFKNFSYTFTKGQKIGIFGENGSGKSTLLNIITGKIQPDSGTIDVGINTKFAYYTQNPEFPDTTLTVLEYVKETAEHIQRTDGKELSASKFLEEYGFEGKIQHSPVSTLSGGEKKRLYLVRLLLQNPNFLILDEPTNDFDIFTMNILEQFLMQYQGCLLLVSHDRYFMDKCAQSYFILEPDGSVSGFVGTCSDYLELMEEKEKAGEVSPSLQSPRSQAAPVFSATPSADSDAVRNACSQTSKKKKRSFKEQKEFETLDLEIPQLEEEQKQLEPLMASTNFQEVQKASTRYNEISLLLEEKYARWEELAENN
jgi:ATP-binding cassette subfamily F protein uup